MKMDYDEIKNYILLKGVHDNTIINCVTTEMKIKQYVKPFNNIPEAQEKIDSAIVWYMNHFKT